jgi:hypothetical protein
MPNVEFSNEEKIAFFDMIADRYYNRNFGTMLKADIDTFIFSTYIEHCLQNNLPFDDYTLSINLGITESKVRSLKERKQLQYPYENYRWKEAFVELIPLAKYNDTKQLIQMNIQDVNLIKDVRHFIYDNGWFDEFQLNPRLFQCRLEYFIALCSRLESEVVFDDETKKSLKELAKSEKEENAIQKILSGDLEDGVKDIIISGSKELLLELLKLIPFGGVAGKAIELLIKVISK